MLLEELAGVLTRTAITKPLALIKQSAQSVLVDYMAAVALVEPLTVPRIVHAGPDDDHVLACALAARADLIVSGDNDLLTLRHYRDIPENSCSDSVRRGRPQGFDSDPWPHYRVYPFINSGAIEPIGGTYLSRWLTLAHPLYRHQADRLQGLMV